MEIRIPKFGMEMTEGTITEWLVEDGAAVAQDQPLYLLETDKVTNEVTAPVAGRREHIARPKRIDRYRFRTDLGCIGGWVGHTGERPGFNTIVYYDTTTDTSVVVLVNSDIPSGKCSDSTTLSDNQTEFPCSSPSRRPSGTNSRHCRRTRTTIPIGAPWPTIRTMVGALRPSDGFDPFRYFVRP
jgi:Biotin-requiring enzyme/Beta-lactamase